MSRRARRIGLQLLLWAAPLSAGLALVMLVTNAPYFRHGPGVPTAGDERAWNAMWGAFGLLAVGSVVGSVSAVVWLARAWRRARRPTGLEWFRCAVNLVFGGAFLWLWLG